MFYTVETRKSVDAAADALEKAVAEHRFGVLHVHDLKKTMRSKGVEFMNECRIFEVCNPGQAARVLNADMAMNMALPCRISVYEEQGRTKIGMIRPTVLLSMLSADPALDAVAEEVEQATMRMIDQAAGKG